MKFYDRCDQMICLSLSTFLEMSVEKRKKYEYYDLNTDQLIKDWDNLSVSDEVELSVIHQYLQVFDYDVHKGIKTHRKAKQKASQVVDKYLDKHLNPKLDPKNPERFPEGISQKDYTELLRKHCELLEQHIFHCAFVEKHFYWKLENEIFYDAMTR